MTKRTEEPKFVWYIVYEISADARQFGRRLKVYKSKRRAYEFMEKSIYRYIVENPVW